MKLKLFISFILAIGIILESHASNSWIEINYGATQYTAYLENISFKKSSFNESAIWSGFFTYKAKARVIESYYGELSENSIVEIIIYVPSVGRKSTLTKLKKPYVLSFCKSKSGIYFTHRDYVVHEANLENLKKLRELSATNPKSNDNHDCSDTNFGELNPDNVN